MSRASTSRFESPTRAPIAEAPSPSGSKGGRLREDLRGKPFEAQEALLRPAVEPTLAARGGGARQASEGDATRRTFAAKVKTKSVPRSGNVAFLVDVTEQGKPLGTFELQGFSATTRSSDLDAYVDSEMAKLLGDAAPDSYDTTAVRSAVAAALDRWRAGQAKRAPVEP